MSALLIILTWLPVIPGKSSIDWYLIEVKKKNIRHGLEITIVAIIAFFHHVLSGVNRIEEWELAGYILMFQTMSYWAFFDASLNLMRGKEVFYVGENAASDKLFKNKIPIYFMTKVFALVLMVVSIVQIFKY